MFLRARNRHLSFVAGFNVVDAELDLGHGGVVADCDGREVQLINFWSEDQRGYKQF